ncbi:MAG: DUF1810 domain-containing protein [Faecalibacterium sp.]|nr:DUF1810 domain-containing protein [Ruminococcus sp.]MCM1391442.1 DUF1810 domain-containing protein [Ruminococcus sp.]MCM1485243.1 DUF1810 domain-containing protein [Faecalibacterium sp.]
MTQQFNLERFIQAQKNDYQCALAEIRNGRKENHWMWYIFPQIKGLGKRSFSQYYAIQGTEEARAYLNNEYLYHNLIEISEALLKLDTNNVKEIFDKPDDLKLKSCMTLFANACDHNEVFLAVLDKFFGGKQDFKTLDILKSEA